VVPEAPLERTKDGLAPAGEGWFVLNARKAPWFQGEGVSASCEFEGTTEFPQTGVFIRVLGPGEPMAMYHWEADQEDFLVLSGEALLIVEGEERRLRQWDFFHCPAGTRHIFVGAGDGPCAILMIGARTEAEQLHYPVSEVAAKHGASAAKETPNPDEAYADWPGEFVPVRLPWPVE
jgi:uncharacterized cupin superfamily protein